jgi:hypothetical protein
MRRAALGPDRSAIVKHDEPVSFVLLDDDRPVTELAGLDPDRDWREFATNTRAWILQTYLRLKAAGCAVALRERFPARGIAVVSASDYRKVLERRWDTTDAMIVVTRGSERRTPAFSDATVVQNPVEADGLRRFFVHLWPQTALLPRDRSRGARIERAAFKGFPKNLDAAFQGPVWSDFLRAQGIEWVQDAVPYHDLKTRTGGLQWPDCRDVDLIVAVRPENPAMYPDRPASKLINAWRAGVPAILGPESAYRALRTNPLDYIEVRNLAEAQAAVLMLLREPNLYLAMVRHGLQRGDAFTIDCIVRSWQELLFERLPKLAHDSAMTFGPGRPFWLRQLSGRWRWRHRATTAGDATPQVNQG